MDEVENKVKELIDIKEKLMDIESLKNIELKKL